MTVTGGVVRGAPTGAAGLDARVTWLSLGAVGLLLGWAVLDRGAVTTGAPWIATAGIVAGIPHGAVDHLVPGWASLRWSSPRRMTLVVAGYLLVAGIAVAVLDLAADVGFAVFLLVSAGHFGWAEVTFAAERRGVGVPRLRRGWWQTLAHGGAVIVLPLFSPTAETTLRPLTPHLVDRLAALPSSWVVGAVSTVAVLAAAALLRQRRSLEAVELVAVLLLFLLAPPLAAFGVYFGCWHALRHTGRLMQQLAPGQAVRTQLLAFAAAAAAPTTAAFVVLGLLWSFRTHSSVVITGVSVLLALTFPHVLVVSMLDRRRRLDHDRP